MQFRRLVVLLVWLSVFSAGALLLSAGLRQNQFSSFLGTSGLDYWVDSRSSPPEVSGQGLAGQPGSQRLQERGAVSIRQWRDRSYAIYHPVSAPSGRPVTLLLAFFPMGGDARSFASSLTGIAEENGWLLVVPELSYGDWRQLEAVRTDDRNQFPWVRSLIDAIPAEVGTTTNPRVLLYGFSRGAQAAHRFAIMYHDAVLAAAVMGAGTYTLPWKTPPGARTSPPLDYPMGVADLDEYCGEPFDAEGVRAVSFWVGVGEHDNNPAEVPRNWDAYEGANRVERASTFAAKMASLGARVELHVVPGIGHQESDASRAAAAAFLRRVEREHGRLAAVPARS